MAFLPETQGTQTQTQQCSEYFESQPMSQVPWGRLQSKQMKLKSLGNDRKNSKLIIDKETTEFFDLTKENFKAGRAETNDLVFTENTIPHKVIIRISKIHFEICRDITDPVSPVYLKDLSRNGTFLNGEKIGINNVRIIKSNDVISMAHPSFKIFVFKDLFVNEISNSIGKSISQLYYIGNKLGEGACGVVLKIYHLRSCQSYAMKIVKKNSFLETIRESKLIDPLKVKNEVNIMKRLEHPCVIKMHDIVDEPNAVYMILEFMKGGDLLHRIISRKFLPEKLSKFLFFQMCHAVKYLHDNEITHRDLKPDNILLESTDEECLLKVSDFGLSKFVQKNSVMKTLCGTPNYVAPEVLITNGIGSYTKKVDIWSLGVVLFTCLSGVMPFSDNYGTSTAEQITKAKYSFQAPAWKNVSLSAKHLIRYMLTLNPERRPSIDDVLKHQWLNDTIVIQRALNVMKISSESPLFPQKDENFKQPAAKRMRK